MGVPLMLSGVGTVLSVHKERWNSRSEKKNTTVKTEDGEDVVRDTRGVERNRHAINLRNLVVGEDPTPRPGDTGEDLPPTPRYFADEVVRSLGLDPDKHVRQQSEEKAQAVIAEKLKSW